MTHFHTPASLSLSLSLSLIYENLSHTAPWCLHMQNQFLNKHPGVWKCDVISKMPHWLRIILGICKLINKINSIYQYLLIVESNPVCYQICPRHIFTQEVFLVHVQVLWPTSRHEHQWSVIVKCSSTLPFVSFFERKSFCDSQKHEGAFSNLICWGGRHKNSPTKQAHKNLLVPQRVYTIPEIMTLVLCHIGSENRPFKWL